MRKSENALPEIKAAPIALLSRYQQSNQSFCRIPCAFFLLISSHLAKESAQIPALDSRNPFSRIYIVMA